MLTNQNRLRIAVVILAIFLFLCFRSFFPGRVFDAEQWQVNASQRGTKVRLAMADRIVARKMLWGKTRAQVTEILGKPPATDYRSDWDLVYWLGPERGFLGIDSEWLVVKLDQNDVVADVKMVHD